VCNLLSEKIILDVITASCSDKRRKNKSKEGSTYVSNGDTNKEIRPIIRIFLLEIFKIIHPDQASVVARSSVPWHIEFLLHKGISLALAIIETLLSAFLFILNRR
jgi:hypothetical protein